MPNVDLDYQESNDVLSLGYDDTAEDTDEVQELLSGTASEEPVSLVKSRRDCLKFL